MNSTCPAAPVWEAALASNVREHDVVRRANNGGGTLDLGRSHRLRTTEHGVQFVYAEEGDTGGLTQDLDIMPANPGVQRGHQEPRIQSRRPFTCSPRRATPPRRGTR